MKRILTKTTFHPNNSPFLAESIKMFYGKSVICKLDEMRLKQKEEK